VRPRAPYLDLGAIQAQVNAFGGSVGEHLGQGAQAQLGPAGHGKATRRQQRAHLAQRTGDGGVVDAVEDGHGGMGKLEAQDHQGGDDPVGDDQLMVRAGSGGPQALMAATVAQAGFLLGGPRFGQLGDQLAQALAGDAGADAMRQGRAGP